MAALLAGLVAGAALGRILRVAVCHYPNVLQDVASHVAMDCWRRGEGVVTDGRGAIAAGGNLKVC